MYQMIEGRFKDFYFDHFTGCFNLPKLELKLKIYSINPRTSTLSCYNINLL